MVKIFFRREVVLSIQTVWVSPRIFLPSILSQGVSSTGWSPINMEILHAGQGASGIESGINRLGTVNDETPEIPVPAAMAIASDSSLIWGRMVHQVLDRSGAASLQMTSCFGHSAIAETLGEFVPVKLRTNKLG